MKGESGAEVVLATWSITAFCFNRAFNSPFAVVMGWRSGTG